MSRINLNKFSLTWMILIVVILFSSATKAHDAHASVLLEEICASTDRIFDLAFSPNDDYLFVSNWRSKRSEPWKARLWEVVTGEVIRDFNYAPDRVAFSPDGNLVVMGDGLNTLLSSIQMGELEYEISHDDISPIGTSYEFTQDSRLLVIDYADEVIVWDINAQQTLRSFPNQSDWQLHQDVDVSPNEKYILTYNMYHEETYLYDFQTGDLVFSFESTLNAMFSPDSEFILTNGRQGLRLWDVETLNVVRNFTSNFERISDIQFTQDSRYLLVVLSSGFKLWDVESGGVLMEFPSIGSSGIYGFLQDRHDLIISEMQRVSDEYVTNIYNIPLNTKIRGIRLENGNIDAFAFTSDGRYLAVSIDNTVQLWDIEQGERMRSFC